MRVRIWGSTGSIASPGAAHVRYGGNTSCVEVASGNGDVVVLDAGSGIRHLGGCLDLAAPIHVVLTHLHIDHVQGLGFFKPLFTPGVELHVWGPRDGDLSFRDQLDRYFSQPLFPVKLDHVGCDLEVHDLPEGRFELPGFTVETAPVAHPGETLAVRLEADDRAAVYLPDHEPEHPHVGSPGTAPAQQLCSESDMLIHDVMYLDRDYPATKGFGHSSVSVAAAFLESLDGLGLVVPFHQEPGYDDDTRDDVVTALRSRLTGVEIEPAREGTLFEL